MSIIPYDVNGDGFDDLVVTDRNADVEHMGVRWLENPGANWDEPWSSRFLGGLAGTRPTFMAVVDLNRDGIEEYVVPLSDRAMLIILWGTVKSNESVYLASTIEFPSEQGFGLLKAVAVADLNNDDRNDLGITFVGDRYGVVWIEKVEDHEGEWQMHVISDVAEGKFDMIELNDVDGDGDLDILTTEEALNLGVLWFENPLIDVEKPSFK